MALILAHFHSVGNTDNLMHLLIIYVSGDAIFSAASLTQLIDMLSLPARPICLEKSSGFVVVVVEKIHSNLEYRDIST